MTTDMPESTALVLRDILTRYDSNSDRSRQKLIGPSEIGTPCRRRLGYRIHEVAAVRRAVDIPWAPIQGTAVHALVAKALEADNARLAQPRWLIEHQVFPDPIVPGSADAFDTWNHMVIDWKHCGDTSIKTYRKHMNEVYRIQAHLYGLGFANAGHQVDWVRIVLLPRAHSFNTFYEWTEAYDRQVAEKALARFVEVIDLCGVLKVDEHPEHWPLVPATPGDGCTWCPQFAPALDVASDQGCPGASLQHRHSKSAAHQLIG